MDAYIQEKERTGADHVQHQAWTVPEDHVEMVMAA